MLNRIYPYIFSFIVPFALLAQSEKVEISRLGIDQIHVTGFTLDKDGVIKIAGVGAGGEKEINKINSYQEDPFNLFAYSWIIDAYSRKMVWRMTIKNSSGDWWNKTNREFDQEIKLPEGDYELYYSSIEPAYASGFMTLGRWIEKMFGDDDWEDHARKWRVSVSQVNSTLSDNAVKKYQRALRDKAIISLSSVGDRAYISRGFSLTKAVDAEIYAVGEGWKGEMFDYGWLVNANTQEKIWTMRHNRTEHAGGAIKNRVERKRIKLDAGDYVLYYKTDDNHSNEQWNANPPYDPEFWGVTIFAGDGNFDPADVKDFRQKSPESIISITRVGDSEYEEEGLIVEKSGNFRIFALGEGRDGKMSDYAWITDVKSGNRIWKMDYYQTEHAGGSDKNRQINDVIFLEKGQYIVHYKTDGSHSYEDWNASEPYEPEKWGITIYPVGKEIMAKKTDSKNLQSKNVLAQLTRVGDDEHLKKTFNLDNTSRIRIKALGEGDWDEMYDYGWISNNKSGRKVWSMRYRNTDHAGGAKKNRIIDTIITLEPGQYTVHYISDDSHSYKEWNASAPHMENDWGITIYRIE